MNPETVRKDKWDILKISAEIALPIVALVFTYFYQAKQQRVSEANLQLAQANRELARAQVEGSLLPYLSSNDPKQREIALSLARVLDEKFGADAAAILALNDPSAEVRIKAGSALRTLSRSGPDDVRKAAQAGLEQIDVMNELRAKGLLDKLRDAEGYLAGGSTSGKEAALTLYREVFAQLSAGARGKLDQKLLADAERDYREGNVGNALSEYRALFADYRQGARD
jgi:hypothetical protein